MPKNSANATIGHEIELGVILKKGGSNIDKKDWKDYVGGYFIALDYTDLTMLKSSMAKGLPWFMSKGQDNFLQLGELIAEGIIDDPHNLELEYKVNSEVRQLDNTGNMLFKIDE